MQTKQHTTLTFAAIAMLLSAAFVWHAGATASRPPAQPTAVAVVDIVDIIAGLHEREVLENQLNTRMEARQAQLDEVVKELEALDADIQFLARGTDEYREKLREGMEKQAVAKARREALSQIVSIDMGSVMARLYTKVVEAIKQISDREGYDIVLFDDSKFEIPDGAPNQEVYRAIITKSVIYRHDSIDITQQVITLMNNEYGAP
jgi:Skp family chaperone for outer membrane proteins